jgi:hypothetical protein
MAWNEARYIKNSKSAIVMNALNTAAIQDGYRSSLFVRMKGEVGAAAVAARPRMQL